MSKISVIVPAYNAASTIKRTIDSILNQTYYDFELIVINDGSTDDTEKVVLSVQDIRVKLISKENGGIAHTRNFGLKQASGELIAFLDADDWMEPNALEMLVKTMEKYNAEMVVCDYRYVYEDGTTLDMHSVDFGVSSMKERSSLLLEVMPQPWNKLVKKEVFDRADFFFPDGLVFEDLCYYSCLLPSVSKVVKLNEVLINYYQMETSIMAGARQIKKTVYDFDRIVIKIDDYYEQKQLGYKKEREALFALNARELVDGILKNPVASIDQKCDVIQSILNTLNQRYSNWPHSSFYTEKYKGFGKVYLLKRRVIDLLFSKGKTMFVLKYIVKA